MRCEIWGCAFGIMWVETRVSSWLSSLTWKLKFTCVSVPFESSTSPLQLTYVWYWYWYWYGCPRSRLLLFAVTCGNGGGLEAEDSSSTFPCGGCFFSSPASSPTVFSASPPASSPALALFLSSPYPPFLPFPQSLSSLNACTCRVSLLCDCDGCGVGRRGLKRLEVRFHSSLGGVDSGDGGGPGGKAISRWSGIFLEAWHFFFIFLFSFCNLD
jgi:hypothetical protein